MRVQRAWRSIVPPARLRCYYQICELRDAANLWAASGRKNKNGASWIWSFPEQHPITPWPQTGREYYTIGPAQRIVLSTTREHQTAEPRNAGRFASSSDRCCTVPHAAHSEVFAPPALAQVRRGHVWVGHVAVGSGATSAVHLTSSCLSPPSMSPAPQHPVMPLWHPKQMQMHRGTGALTTLSTRTYSDKGEHAVLHTQDRGTHEDLQR